MASEAGLHSSTSTGSHPAVSMVSREAAHWMLARVADGHEATFALEIDERFWRARRVHGVTVSMFEAKHPGALSVGDLAASIGRWAASVGLTVRTAHDDHGFRVTLSRPAD